MATVSLYLPRIVREGLRERRATISLTEYEVEHLILKMRVFPIITVLFVLYNVVPVIVASIYGDHGHGNQHLTFWFVFGSFLSPMLWPVLHFKTLVLNVVLPALNLGWVEAEMTYALGRALLTPGEPFHPERIPPKPDFSNEDYWSMLPERTKSIREDASELQVGDTTIHLKEKICSAVYLLVCVELRKEVRD